MKIIIFLLLLTVYGCMNPMKPEPIHKYLYEEGYDITEDGPIFTNWQTNVVLIISNIVYKDEPFNDYEGKAKMEGIYLSSPYGTYNAAKIKDEGEISYWAVSVGSLFFQHSYFNDDTMKVMGNIYTEKAYITFLYDCEVNYSGLKYFNIGNESMPTWKTNKVFDINSKYANAKVFKVELRGSDYRQNFHTNYVIVYNHGVETEVREWTENIKSKGHHLTYWEYENNLWGGQTLVQRFKNGEITSEYNIRLPKAGRNTRWRNRRNGQFLEINPYHDLWLVKAFNKYEAIYIDSFTGEYVAFTVRYERKNIPEWMGRQNQSDKNMKVLSLALPKNYYEGTSGGRYSVVNSVWKNATLVGINALAGHSQLSYNIYQLIKSAEDFNNGDYESHYKELSFSPLSADGYMYHNYFWDKRSISPWGFMQYIEYYTDEYGHIY